MKGVIVWPAGAGVEEVLVYLLTVWRQPAVVICPTTGRMEVWSQALRAVGIDPKSADYVKTDKSIIRPAPVYLETVGRMMARADLLADQVGVVIADEVYSWPVDAFEGIIGKFDAGRLIGTSSNPFRRDGLGAVPGWFVGPVVHTIRAEDLVSSGFFCRLKVTVRVTGYRNRAGLDPMTQNSQLLTALSEDPERNRLIAEDLRAELAAGNRVAFFTSRKKHLDDPAFDGLRDDERLTVISGGGPAVHGAALFMALPVRNLGEVIQIIGRVIRATDSKRVIRLYDYEDRGVEALRSALEWRRRIYRRYE